MPTQSQIDFIIKIMEFKINETGLPFTRACYTVSKSIKLSQATLIKAARGNFTYKTAVKMSGAGWFSMKEYEKMSTGTSNNTTHRAPPAHANPNRSEEHTSELQS